MLHLSASQQFQATIDSSSWQVIETEFDPSQLHHKETVFTLGNGYLGTRGSFEEGYSLDDAATLIHGVYDDIPISKTELVNCPNWLPLILVLGGNKFSLDSGEIIKYERRLDLRLGILSRDIRWRCPNGYTFDLHFERFVSLADCHILAIRVSVKSIDFSGEISIESGFDNQPETQGVKHWQVLNNHGTENTICLHGETLKSAIQLGMAAKLQAVNSDVVTKLKDASQTSSPTSVIECNLAPEETITVEKLVTIFTSRDIENPHDAALERLASITNYTQLLATHIAAWEQVWQDSDIVIEGDNLAQLSVRYNLFQLLAVAPRHDDKVSIPAKSLSGYAYKGHIFWDTEIFILPFLSLTQPVLARNLLNYRYHNLAGARRKAEESGYKGAMFPWESAVTGDEVTPRWIPAPNNGELIRIWSGDIEIHISSDVAFAAWNYWKNTGDDEWMRSRGAEIILDTAIFWESRVQWNSDRSGYDIIDVIGPDENHDHVNNNAFTNVMVQWHLQTALGLWDWLKRSYPESATNLRLQLQLENDRLEKWASISNGIYINQDEVTGLIEQFEGFFQLEDVNLEDYEPRNKSMQALLGIEETNEKQILKQPDVLMLLYLLRERYDHKTLQSNWDYYNPRTDHSYGSSLGPAIHAIVGCDLNKPEEAYTHFMRAALVDLEDVRLNAHEGIHAASAGGVWQAVVFGFAGIHITEFGPIACPCLPPGWTRLKFKLNWRNQWYEFDIPSGGKIMSFKENVESSSPIKGVIFDLDGVLTDTAEYHYLAWKQLADEEGIPFDVETNEGMRGLPRRESLLHILGDRHVTEEKLQEMMARKNSYYIDFMEKISPTDLLPGVRNLLEELKAAGIKISLGSSSKNAQTVIEKLGIAGDFHAIADGYSVSQPKPAPDLFLYAAKQLGLSPDECVVFEDATAGVDGAIAAGMYTVGLGPKERVGKANVVLSTLEGVQWEDLQKNILAIEFAMA